MVRGFLKSGRYRKVKKRVGGSKTITRYLKRKPKQAHCGKCGNVLHGIPRATLNDMKKLSKTERRPQRPYGGVLCSRCQREVIKKGVE